MSRLILLVLLLAFPALLAGALPEETRNLRLSEYQKQNWQVEDGLPENNVRMIAQRSDGRLFLATSSGLSTFDGLHFEGVSLAGSPDGEAVNAFLEEKDGTLWVGTDGRGVLRYSPGMTGGTNISERAGRINERIRNFYRDREGTLWIATQNGVERFRAGQLEVLAQAGMISGDITTPFAEDGRNGLFFVTSKGLFHWRDEAWQQFPLRHAEMGRAVAVFRDAQQRLWVGAENGVLQLIPLATGGYLEVIRAHIPSPVTVLVGDAQGNLWVGTHQAGVRRIHLIGNEPGNRSDNQLQGAVVDSVTTRDGLADDSICSMFVDSAQDLWIGTQTGGLSRWRKGAFATYVPDKDFPTLSAANVFSDSRGDLWLGTWGQGLLRIHKGHLVKATPPGMLISASIRAIAEDQRGQIWIGTWFDGVYRYDGRSYRHYLLGTESPGNAVSSILVDRHGGLYIGTYKGLVYFAGGEPQASRQLFLGSKLITCLLEDADGSVLVGTTSGLFRLRSGTVLPVQNLPHPQVLSMIRDSLGYVWVGTKAGGLALLRPIGVRGGSSDQAQDRAELLGARSGLPSLPVNTVIEDGDGDLWLGTIRGIARVKVSALHDVADGKQQSLTPIVFGRDDGMRSSECVGTSLPASTRTNDGSIWFVTAKGFAHTTDVAEKLAHRYPMVPILGWSLTDDLDPAHAQTGDQVLMAPSQPDVTFLFNVIDLSNPSQLEFRYRLIPYDGDWVTTRGRTARYRRLPAGAYRFEVQARQSGEPWGATTRGVHIRQRSHIYQTWYAYACMLLLAIIVIIYAFRQRVQLVKGQIGVIIEERNRIAEECHDTLMAGLAAISWQLEATAKLFRNDAMAATPAANSCEIARSMVSHCQAEARRIIWDLRDTEEITSSLSRALERSISAQESYDSVCLAFAVEGEEVPLAPADVHHMVCIAQEALSNALRHAAPANISIKLRYEISSLSLSIRDDGCGLRGDTSKVGHFGIPVMEERARKVGGVLRLQSSHLAGTEVSVIVAFNPIQITYPQQSHVVPWIGV